MLVDERMVDPGDWTGPGGAQRCSRRGDIDVAVLETARGGIVLRGHGLRVQRGSVLTNVSSDHLDLQGIHTLPELAEVKATVARITKPDGWVVLNGDDPLVAGGRPPRPRQRRPLLDSPASASPASVRRHLRDGRPGYLVRDGWLVEARGEPAHRDRRGRRGSRSRSAGWRATTSRTRWRPPAGRAGSAPRSTQVARGPARLPAVDGALAGPAQPVPARSRIVIVDFAHNEAGISAVLDVAEGIAAGAAGRAAPITAIIGTAGDRPDDTLRGIGRIAAERAQRVAIKETRNYLRGRTEASVVGELLAGRRPPAAGRRRDVPIYESETGGAPGGARTARPAARHGGRPDAPGSSS